MRLTGAHRPWTRVDQTVLALVRLIHDDHWSSADAAAELRRQGHDDTALVLARARVAAAEIERPSVYGARAIATLNTALAPSPLRGWSPA